MDDRKKQRIISSFPFPIGYVYQVLAVTELKGENPLWLILRSSDILLKVVGTIALSDYLQNREKFSDSEINRCALDMVEQNSLRTWHTMLEKLTRNIVDNNEFYAVQEIKDLQTPFFELPQELGGETYTWLQVMDLFVQLGEELFVGKYRLHTPPLETLKLYSSLLEQAYCYCKFLEKYGVYVLVSKDERKTRGFLCCGTKSKPIGIRGISDEKWLNYKGRPFLSYKQKQNVSLFPFIAALVQQVESKKSFSDLLFFETLGLHSMTYFSYRHSRIVDYKECSSNALFLMQKDIRWLKKDAAPVNITPPKENTHDYTIDKWTTVYYKIFANSHQKRYAYISSENGTGKTSMARLLQDHESLLREEIPALSRTIIVYFFCDHENYYSYIDFLKSIYAQILQKVFTLSEEKIEKRIAKLPYDSEAMLIHLFDLMEKANKEELAVYNKNLLIVCDGLFSIPEYIQYVKLITPTTLPSNISCLFFIAKNVESCFLRFLHTREAPIVSLNHLQPFSFTGKEILEYIHHYAPSLDVHKKDLIREKCRGNMAYAKFCLEAYSKKYLQIHSDLPENIYDLFMVVWNNLPSDNDFLAQRMLILAAISQEKITDNMVAEIFRVSKDEIRQVKYSINIFLKHKKLGYTTQRIYRDCILQSLSSYDKKCFYGALADYHARIVEQNLSLATPHSLLHLAHYYKEAQNHSLLFSLAFDREFRQEKLRRFKSYLLIRRDLYLAMQACTEDNNWQKLFELSSEYSRIVHQSLRGVTHTFRYAEDGDYTAAVEMARGMNDAIDVFTTLLVILVLAIENEDYQETDFIFEALEGIKDTSIGYVGAGLEPFVIYVLQKISQTDILPIHTIISKHGLIEANAVSHLFDILAQVNFTENQLQIFISKIVQTSTQLNSEEEKYQVIAEVIPVLYEINSFEQSPEVWQWITTLVNSISDTLIQIDCCIVIAKTVPSEHYMDVLKPYIESFATRVEQDIVLIAKYAQLLGSMDELQDAKYQLERAFIIINQQSEEQQYQSYLKLITIISEIGTFDEMRVHWKRLFSASQKEITCGAQERLISEVTIYFAQVQMWDHVLSLLPQLQLLKLEVRTNTFFHLSHHLKGIVENSARQYWDVILEETKSLKDNKKRLTILSNAADGLFRLETLASDAIWKKYLAVCDLLKDVGHDEDKNKALSYLGCKMADNGYAKNAQTIISRLSSPKYRSKPLSRLSLYKVKRRHFDEALKLTEDIVNAYERYDVYLNVLEKATTEKINLIVGIITNDVQSGNYESALILKIIDRLLNPLQIDNTKNIWHEVFSWIPHLSLRDKTATITRSVEKLSAVSYYEKTKLLWVYIFKATEELDCVVTKGELYVQISKAFAGWSQLQETIKYLDMALGCCERMELNTRTYHLAKVANYFREIGEETRCSDILKTIDKEIWENRTQIHNVYEYIVYLFNSNCVDLAQSLLEKTILVNVELCEETPEIDILTRIMSLCIEAQDYALARGLFFQILPKMYKRGQEKVSQYEFLQLLPKMKEHVDIVELWKHAESVVLNFSKVSLQQNYLEALGDVVLSLDNYEQNKELWGKLLSDAQYVGKGVQAIRAVTIVAKKMLLIAPWEDFAESFDFCLDVLGELESEYEQADALQFLAKSILIASDFSVGSDTWQKFRRIPASWKKEDCKNSAYASMAKALIENANVGMKRIFFSEAEQLANRISKSQQICEIYLLIVDKYHQCNMLQEVSRTMEKTIDMGEGLGKFYQSTILPQIIFSYAKMDMWENVWPLLKGIIDNTLQMNLLFDFAEIVEDRKTVLEKVMAIIESADRPTGFYFISCIRLAKYIQGKDNIDAMMKKAIDSWSEIVDDNSKREAIDSVADVLTHIKLPQKMWRQLLAAVDDIEIETYRFWGLQKIAFTLLRTPDDGLVENILDKISAPEIKIPILEEYVEKIYETSREKALDFVLTSSGEERIRLARRVASKAAMNKDRETLLCILVECPGSFSLNTLVISEILRITLHTTDKDSFQSMLATTLKIWEIHV
ncbi:hypothetical protein [Candidatus Uabimicrobium amorphum]|uniref:Nephrocystin 3-like N-terminal domain-containing protein n=1 Tax=Uabimicrobium amorphum TaxID=2596890 RepID=A0A5S9F5F0_UABAM|nr:hypothetical protein [Candidatus Uabimicrobium amorphum]BBM86766.1 hypothetical protein UABAM_05153 [Candidatus Uabimicrobium amorphum]